MRGHNFDMLESFQSYVHNLAENMGVQVEEGWVTPAKSTKVSSVWSSLFPLINSHKNVQKPTANSKRNKFLVSLWSFNLLLLLISY